MSINSGRPYFYLKAGPRSQEITRNHAGGSTSICIPTEDGGWIDYTLSLAGVGDQRHVIISSRTNRQDRETVLLREIVPGGAK